MISAKDVLVLAFSQWASLWEKSKPVYQKTARALAPVRDLALYTFDTNENAFDAEAFGGPPTQYLDKKAWLVLYTTDGGCGVADQAPPSLPGRCLLHGLPLCRCLGLTVFHPANLSAARRWKAVAAALHGKDQPQGHSQVA